MNIDRQFLFKITWKLKDLIAPKLRYSQDEYEEVLNSIIGGHENPSNLRWLDLGCGHHILPPWKHEAEKVLVNKVGSVVGIDYDQASLDKHHSIRTRVRGDISDLPFEDNQFDLVTSNMVFEHLSDPEKQLREITRVLAHGGTLLFHTPNKFGYVTLAARLVPDVIKDKLVYILDGRKEEDVFPAYYRINSPKAITRYAGKNGLKAKNIYLICTSPCFSVIPPIALVELFWIRLLMTKMFRPWRTNLLVEMKKE